jgi:hypothetical protein
MPWFIEIGWQDNGTKLAVDNDFFFHFFSEWPITR